MKALRLRMCAAAFGSIVASASFGQVITLTSGHSSLDLLNNGSAFAGRASNWLLSGVNYLYQEDFFFRRTNSGAVDGLGALGNVQGLQLLPNMAQFTYGSSTGISASVLYTLTGNATTAALTESALITNNTGSTIHFEIFEYDDFDLSGTSGNDQAWVVDSNQNAVRQLDVITGAKAEVSFAPKYDYVEIDKYPDLLNKLFSASFANLDSNKNAFGPGDAAFALQWVRDIAPGNSLLISKNKLLTVPEPGTLVVFGGLVALALRRRSRR